MLDAATMKLLGPFRIIDDPPDANSAHARPLHPSCQRISLSRTEARQETSVDKPTKMRQCILLEDH
jgi:hypothetical protein